VFLSIRSSKIGHYKTKWEFKENSSSKTGPAKRMKEKRAKIFPAKIKKVRKVSFIQADLFYDLDCNRSVSSFLFCSCLKYLKFLICSIWTIKMTNYRLIVH